MDSLKALIERHIDEFPEFKYYCAIIEKAQRNEEPHPDICIECCNSLFQGISKTIILGIEPRTRRAELDKPSNAKSDILIKRALRCLRENDDVYENDFTQRGASLAFAIATLRNARGDICHGRAVPKELQSDRRLARVVMEMSDSLLRYMLSSFYTRKLGARLASWPGAESGDADAGGISLEYGDYPVFNEYLDELNPPQGKVVHSLALFVLFREEYEIQLAEFLDAQVEEGPA